MLGMLPNHKKIASLIMALPGEGGVEQEKKVEVESDYSVGFEAAGDKILKAIEAKDKKNLVEGLKDLITLLDMQEDAQEEMMGEE